MLLAEKSSTVRSNWSEFVDTVLHKVPKFVQRNERDVFMSLNMDIMLSVLEGVRYSIEVEYDDEADEYVAGFDDTWVLAAKPTPEETIDELLKQYVEYSFDYFSDFGKYYNAPNLKSQVPYVLKALILNDVEKIKKYIDVKYI